MNPELLADLLLGSGSPRDAARRTLAWLMDYHHARSVSLWRTGSDREALTLEMGAVVDEGTLHGARSAWAEHRGTLSDGSPVVDRAWALVPARVAGSFVYVEGVDRERLDVNTVATVATVAFKALRRDAPPEASDSDGLRRYELMVALRLHEWNIARVARVKGVTRKTIYDWLRRYDIARERVVKS